jgi:hypothetical protein
VPHQGGDTGSNPVGAAHEIAGGWATSQIPAADFGLRPSFVRLNGTTFPRAASFPSASASTRSRSSVACWYRRAAVALMWPARAYGRPYGSGDRGNPRR